jgi:hypothetical protein
MALIIFLLLFCFRLQDILGYQSVVKNLDELKYPKYLKHWEELKKTGKDEAAAAATEEEDLGAGIPAGARAKLVMFLDNRFSHLKAEVKEKIVDLVAKADQASDREVSELAGEVLDPLARGLTTHYVSVAGTIFKVPTSVWQEVETALGPTGNVQLKF